MAKISSLPRFVVHGATIVENESTGRRLADLSEVCRLANDHPALLGALHVADDHLARIGVATFHETRLTVRAAIAKTEGR